MALIHNIKSHPLIIPIVEVIAKAISFINILLLIRIFSINEYADYSYIISIILWASVLMDSGINDLIYNKSLLKDSSNLNKLFSSKIYLSLIVILFLSFYFAIKKPLLVNSAIILSFVIFISSLSALFKMYSRGNGFIDIDITTIISEPILRLVFLTFIYFSTPFITWQLWQVFLVYLLAGFLAFVYNYFRLSQYFKFKLLFDNIKAFIEQIKDTLSESKFFLLYYLMFIGLQRIDIIIIEKYCSKSDLAIFSSAITLFQVAHLFFFSLITSKFMMLYERKNYLIKYLLPGVFLIAIISQFISPFIFKYLFPPEYAGGSLVFNYIILSIIPSVFSLYFITKNNYEGKTKLNFIFLMVMLFLKIIIYNYLKSDNLAVYYTVYGLIEILLLLIFFIHNLFYESTSSK